MAKELKKRLEQNCRKIEQVREMFCDYRYCQCTLASCFKDIAKRAGTSVKFVKEAIRGR